MDAFAPSRPCRAAIWIDTDHVKALNDRMGPQGGDRAIAAIGRAVRDVAGDEYMCRAPGDEFLVALPGGWSGDAVALAERIRVAVETVGPGMTVSVGVAVADETSGSESGALVDRAEHCQLQAKARGRNAVSDRPH
jgi:diguanylate cyclase (GGDEF)-like protein